MSCNGSIRSMHDVSVPSFTITDEHGNDSKNGRKLLKTVVRNLKIFFGDKAYESKGMSVKGKNRKASKEDWRRGP